MGDNHTPPLKEPASPQKKKFWGPVKVFFLTLIGFVVFILSPAPSLIARITPEPVSRTLLSDVYRDVVLSDQLQTLDEPFKIEQEEPLQVLGRGTGLCFTFNEEDITPERIDLARRNRPLAEIIVIGDDKNEYKLGETSVAHSEKIAICQKFSRDESVPPDAVTGIFIRPLKPFTTSKIVWATSIDVNYGTDQVY